MRMDLGDEMREELKGTSSDMINMVYVFHCLILDDELDLGRVHILSCLLQAFHTMKIV